MRVINYQPPSPPGQVPQRGNAEQLQIPVGLSTYYPRVLWKQDTARPRERTPLYFSRMAECGIKHVFLSNAHPLSHKRHRSLLFIQYTSMGAPMALYVIRHGRVSASRHAAIRVRCAALAGELRLGRRRPRLQRRMHAHSWRAVGHVVAAANWHAGASGQRPAGSGQRAHQLRRGARRRRQPPTREPPVGAAHRAAAALTEAAISPRLLRELLLLPPLRVHLVGARARVRV